MKRSHKLIAAAMSLVTVIGAASCGGGGGGRTENTNNGGEAANTTAATTTTALETYATDESLQAAAGEVKVNEDLHPEKKLKFLSSWAYDETQAGCEIFKANYGIPEEGDASYGDYADKVVQWISYAYGTGYDKLGQMIASGDSPDVYQFEKSMFPLTAYKKMFQPIDDIIDMSGSEWDGWRELSEKFKWDGKMYCPVQEYKIAELWYYRRSVIEEAGLPDPYELYRKGEWDWDAFLDMAQKFQQTGENKYVCDGWYAQSLIFATTGVPVVGIGEDGKLVNNLYDPNVERAADLISTLCAQNYRYPLVENGYSVNAKAWVNGDTLFWDDGTWFYQGDGHKYCEKMGWDYDEIFFVPTPKDPKADKYYHDYDVFGFALCAGSTNLDTYKAFVQSHILANNDPDVKATSREKLMNDEKWTETQLSFREELESVTDCPLVPVFDFRTGVDISGTQATTGETPMDYIVKKMYYTTDDSFTAGRAEYGGVIQNAIDELNASLG